MLGQEQDCLAVEPLQFGCNPQELPAWEVEGDGAVAANAESWLPGPNRSPRGLGEVSRGLRASTRTSSVVLAVLLCLLVPGWKADDERQRS